MEVGVEGFQSPECYLLGTARSLTLYYSNTVNPISSSLGSELYSDSRYVIISSIMAHIAC
jgi:hypothetical protein